MMLSRGIPSKTKRTEEDVRDMMDSFKNIELKGVTPEP